jgi:putative oxygen-independent coproporphyrinogen III oxidase
VSFGVYIHWPYCAHLCPYCDFNIYRARGRDSAPLLDAIVADVAAHAARYGRREAQTIFLGGGTPSLLSAREIARLVEAVDQSFGLARDAEITLECNPEDRAHFTEHAAAGVNRFSIGVQALDDASLRALGRRHDAAEGRSAVTAAARTGRRVSIDLIYAREGQSPEAWESELRAALQLPAEHFSLYQLTIEAGTAFDRAVRRGRLHPPDNDRAAMLYELTQAICDAGGAPAYEISNHARGEAAQSGHNLIYWRGGDWLGVGPGAHGRITHEGARLATKATDRPEAYIAAPVESVTTLTAEETAEEFVLMGLRLSGGLDRAAAERLRGRPLDAEALRSFGEAGLLVATVDRVRLTSAGRLLADRIAQTLAL